MSTPTPPDDRTPVVLDRITEVQRTKSGKHYFAAYFKAGLFGRSVRRSFFGLTAEDGSVNWERASPEALMPLVGQDLSAQVSIEAADVEPKEITIKATGEVIEITSMSVVRLEDETLESALRVYGHRLRESKPEVQPIAPPGFHVVAGDGASV